MLLLQHPISLGAETTFPLITHLAKLIIACSWRHSWKFTCLQSPAPDKLRTSHGFTLCKQERPLFNVLSDSESGIINNQTESEIW